MHSTTHYYIVRVGGRPAVMAQWHGTGGSSQRCTTDGGCVTEVFRTTCAVHIYIADCEDLWLQSYVAIAQWLHAYIAHKYVDNR